MRGVVVFFSFFGRVLILWEVGGRRFLLVVFGDMSYMNMCHSSCAYGGRGLIGGTWGVKDLEGPILNFSLLGFCFRSLAFGSTLEFCWWNGEYLSEP